ncbi:MAG: cytochrome c [Verrucomicrobiota bacterium]
MSEEPTKISEVDPRAVDYDESTDIAAIHSAIERERRDPQDGHEPIPLWLMALCMLVLFMGGAYLTAFSGGFSSTTPAAYELTGGVAALMSEGGAAAVTAADRGPVELTPELLATIGERVYSNCASCHQANGLGQPGVNPPLAGSDWVTGSEERLVRVLLHGLQGPITINGTTQNWSGNMVAWASLGDKQVAAVLTYIRQNWGNDSPAIMPETVTRIKEETAGRTAQWTEVELKPYE